MNSRDHCSVDIKPMAAVTLAVLSRCLRSKQQAYHTVVCERSFCSHTTGLQRFVPWAKVLKKYRIRTNGINEVLT